MGIEIDQERFSRADHARFKEKLQQGLVTLKRVLAQPGFGEGETTIGSELELFLIDRESRPLCVSQQVVSRSASSFITPEMGSFTIELSTPPALLAGRPFTALGAYMTRTIDRIRDSAGHYGARPVPISILPTFTPHDFDAGIITDRPRYRALARALRRGRNAPFDIRIDGEQPLHLSCDHATMEAANTAFQLHLRVRPADFARSFNAAMLLTAPVLAAAGNSPTFLGRRLWNETRVALFKQAGDDRPQGRQRDWHKPARIGFGNGWVREGALELFAESVALHEPILPVCADAEDDSAPGVGAPTLSELRLHHGTIWKWNRPVYDPAGDGHLRIELRALPAGPSMPDMLANASFLIGAILAVAPEIDKLLPSLPFAMAKRNFYRAAQYGLDAELVWPAAPGAAPRAVRARDLVLELLPLARQGLTGAGVAAREADHFLDIAEQRVRSGITGAVWQVRALDALQASGIDRDEALARMLELYLRQVSSGLPVHRWSAVDRTRGFHKPPALRAVRAVGVPPARGPRSLGWVLRGRPERTSEL